ncbi:MAG: hypothetical protein ACUVUR_00575 [bacterium]
MSEPEARLNRLAARIVDVNLNRLGEGLKVIEDLIRFGLKSPMLLRRVRALRTKVGKELTSLRGQVIEFRASEDDFGRSDRFDRLKRATLEAVLMANFKRAEEAARVLEEVLKVPTGCRTRDVEYRMKRWSARFKEVRFRLYDLEKAAIVRLRGKGLDLRGAGSILLADNEKSS